MSNLTVEGKLHKVFDTEQKTETFQAREFVIEVQDGQYPQFVKFQLTQDRCQIIDGHEPGQMIKVHFDLRGREWQGKYFTNLNAWRVEGQQAAPPEPNEPPYAGVIEVPISVEKPDPSGIEDDPNDLPF